MKRRDHSLKMHRFLVVTGIIAAYSMVILNTVSGGQTDVVHICCYSTDPSSYDPKCYDCDAMVYKNALMACLNMTDLPKNISYKAATCLEKNCQIQIPKVSEAETMKLDPFIEQIFKLWFSRQKRSLSANNIDGSDLSKGRHVVKEVSTFVSKEETTFQFMDPEYM
ncbi:uncharacterized protein LOC129981338 [Argiope bruennichi]|uniref:Uncharacterized protein n=1 Tax=Argiope bruennichi TaxID=94029 RepID=A0A8T0G153_ARGBR|nr:uncharacterized protein LOC129981338 [Argiope bruennichi]KAF8795559.1 hypothetical protein HNY73_000048 [Argiope bruennichi]